MLKKHEWKMSKQICIRTTNELHKKIVDILRKEGKSLSQWFREVCKYYIEKHDEQGKKDYKQFHELNPLSTEDLLVLDKFKIDAWYHINEFTDMNLNEPETIVFNELMHNGYFIRSGASLEIKRIM